MGHLRRLWCRLKKIVRFVKDEKIKEGSQEAIVERVEERKSELVWERSLD